MTESERYRAALELMASDREMPWRWYRERAREALGTPPPVDDDIRGDLQCWFDLSYSSYCVMPRVLMEAMSTEWQERMARLLFEWNDTWTNWPDDFTGCRVQLIKRGRLVSTPSWMINYRHPDLEQIARIRGDHAKA